MPAMKIATEGDLVAENARRPKATAAFDRLGGSGQESRMYSSSLLIVLSILVLSMVFKYEDVFEFLGKNGNGLGGKITTRGDGGGDADLGLADTVESSLLNVMDALRQARAEYDAYLEADYGNYTAQVFGKDSIWAAFERPSERSDSRLKRRMKIKIIEAQLGVHGVGVRPTFTWVTGGHSAAAAHGNMLNQSYTVQVGRASSIMFDAVGIDFRSVARAMGGTSSGPEMSLCLDAIFGQDIDVLWWDYGMTDGGKEWLYWLWANQAGMHPTFPALIAYNEKKGNVHEKLEENGQAVFQLGKEVRNIRAKFPDSSLLPNPDSLPPGVAWFMCDGSFENSEPCKERKWKTKPYCGRVSRYQTSWHNGWKDHLFLGSMQSAFLVYLLTEAVEELNNHDSEETPVLSNDYLKELREENEADQQLFMRSELPKDWGEAKAIKDGKIWEAFVRGNAVCHSARLPSTARALGLVTGSMKKATHVEAGYYEELELGYENMQGLPEPQPMNSSTAPMLTRTSPRQDCAFPMEHDYKDAFVIRESDGWMTDVYPNSAEADVLMKSYGEVEKQGYVILCTTSCDWGKCPSGFVRTHDIGKILDITIDDRPVVGVTPLLDDCALLHSDSGDTFGDGKKDGRHGQYEMKFRVHGPDHFVYLSSVIVV